MVRKSPGPDQLHPRILYETRDVVLYPLFLIFNQSFKTGVLPYDWKLAEVNTVDVQTELCMACTCGNHRRIVTYKIFINKQLISMAYFTTIVTLLFDENDIFISLESSIHALQDGCSISVGYKI